MTESQEDMTFSLGTAAITEGCTVETVLMWKWMADGIPVRIEMDDDWYLVGVPEIRLDGLAVQVSVREYD